MARRAGVILLVVFQAFWLNVVVPGHTRGIVTLAGPGGACGSHSAAPAAGHACCPARHRGASPGGPKMPTADEQSRCAICFFAAALSTPPVIDTTLPPLGPAGVLPVPAPRGVAAVHAPPPYDGRGPPPV